MNRELFLAFESGDVTTIQRLHRQNTRVLLDVTFQGDTPLHIAAREGHLPIVRWILQVKPSLARARNKDRNTPLHEAAKCGNREVAEILLQHKKNSAYYSNKFSETALIIASRYGHLETVKLLLVARSYNNLIEMHRSFRVAAYGRYPDVAQAILDNPIKPRGFCRLLRVLVQCDTYRDVTKAGFDYLLNIYRESVNRVATLNLHSAIHGGDTQILKAVLNSPAWKDNLMTMENDCGWCAIHVAAMKGSSDIINEFLSRWPDSVEIRNSDHKSVLHIAVEYNQFDIAKNLLLNKSPQRIVELVSRDHNRFHNTALHLAAKNGVNSELLYFLLSHQCVAVNAVNDEDMTALDLACVAAKDNIQHKLEDAGGIRVSLMPKSDTTSVPSNESKEGGDKEIIDTQIVVAKFRGKLRMTKTVYTMGLPS